MLTNGTFAKHKTLNTKFMGHLAEAGVKITCPPLQRGGFDSWQRFPQIGTCELELRRLWARKNEPPLYSTPLNILTKRFVWHLVMLRSNKLVLSSGYERWQKSLAYMCKQVKRLCLHRTQIYMAKKIDLMFKAALAKSVHWWFQTAGQGDCLRNMKYEQTI